MTTIDIDLREAGPDERQPWTCDVCRKSAPWGETWSWYGSYRAAEDCGHIVVTCSRSCRDSAKGKRLVAAFDAEHGHDRANRAYGCHRRSSR
jgi:hypothetical protein